MKTLRKIFIILIVGVIFIQGAVFATVHLENPKSHYAYPTGSSWWGSRTCWAETEWPDSYHYTRVKYDNNSGDSGRRWGWNYTNTPIITGSGAVNSYYGHDHSTSY